MVTKGKSAHQALKALFATIFGVSFILHGLTDFRKFLRGDTTMTSTIEERSRISYPVVTVCPGNPFNYTAMEELGLHPNFWVYHKVEDNSFNKPYDLKEVENWWDASIFPESSIVSQVTHYQSMRPLKRVPFGINPISTVFFGKCFMYQFDHSFNGSKEEHIAMELRFPPSVDFLTVRIHETVEEKWQIGFNIWEKTPFSIIVQPDTSFVISMPNICHKISPQ